MRKLNFLILVLLLTSWAPAVTPSPAPTATPMPSVTPAPTVTPTATPTPIPTLPPEQVGGLEGVPGEGAPTKKVSARPRVL